MNININPIHEEPVSRGTEKYSESTKAVYLSVSAWCYLAYTCWSYYELSGKKDWTQLATIDPHDLLKVGLVFVGLMLASWITKVNHRKNTDFRRCTCGSHLWIQTKSDPMYFDNTPRRKDGRRDKRYRISVYSEYTITYTCRMCNNYHTEEYIR